jgi:hypothetical protein
MEMMKLATGHRSMHLGIRSSLIAWPCNCSNSRLVGAASAARQQLDKASYRISSIAFATSLLDLVRRYAGVQSTLWLPSLLAISNGLNELPESEPN